MRRVGGYALLERLGAGGAGEVFRGVREDGRVAAVKLIDADGQDGTAAARFVREVRAIQKLTSPHTVRLFEAGDAGDDTLYYAMELLVGHSLRELVERYGPVPPDRAIALLRQACSSLAEAHERGIVHRDLKPGNLFVVPGEDGADHLKVLDFGLVRFTARSSFVGERLTAHRMVFGTAAYAPPESLQGSHDFDERSDIYSLGCVLFWLITGRLVFESDSPVQTVLAHARRLPPSPGELSPSPIPEELDGLVLRCLAKAPGERPSTVRALDEALGRCPGADAWTAARARQWWRAHPRRRGPL